MFPWQGITDIIVFANKEDECDIFRAFAAAAESAGAKADRGCGAGWPELANISDI